MYSNYTKYSKTTKRKVKNMSVKIGIIIGSTRPGRSGKAVAEWYKQQVNDIDDIEFDLIDLAEYDLPLLDEAYPASMGQYQNSHTKEWANIIAGYDGYVWVTAEYNHAPPASLLNAISYLFKEWNKKPVAFVGYGNMAGARAIEHLRAVAGELDMVDTRTAVGIRNPWAMRDEKGNIRHELVFGDPAAQAEQLKWWAALLKNARNEAALV
jgi:NAD(P)H-dependent FMN reductase